MKLSERIASLGATQQKVLLILLTATVFTICPMNGRQVHRLIRDVGREWRKIDRRDLQRSLDTLHKRKLITFKKRGKYWETRLTAAGRIQADIYKMARLKIPRPALWDRKWRIVCFDIMEDDRALRNFFRRQLKRLRFYELQKSVWVFPYPCRKHMERLSGLYQRGLAIRYIEATYIDNETHLKQHFNLV